MTLYIGGKAYNAQSELDDLLKAVKDLPSPLPDVINDLDDNIYTVQLSPYNTNSLQDVKFYDVILPTAQNNTISKKINDISILLKYGSGFLINKQENSDFKIIKGKDGHLFSKESKINDKKAYNVYQGDVGFASSGKIGTGNVHDCVALIIQDKASKKTALAHVTTDTKQWSLSNILSYMPAGEKEVIMFGGQHDQGEDNVRKILSVLVKCKHNISINKSYVCDRRYIHDKSYNFRQTCYVLNTKFGNVIVDTSNLEVSCNNSVRIIPKVEWVSNTSYDIDRLPYLNSSSDIEKYNEDMDNLYHFIPNTKLQSTQTSNRGTGIPMLQV